MTCRQEIMAVVVGNPVWDAMLADMFVYVSEAYRSIKNINIFAD
jgi:hypothetical protein